MLNSRPLPHRVRRWTRGQGETDVFSLNTAVMAVGEGNYGRLGPASQRRYTDANRELMLPEPDNTATAPVRRLQIGHTLPRGSAVAGARLDGKRVSVRERLTNRGLEVTVPTKPGAHRLEVRSS